MFEIYQLGIIFAIQCVFSNVLYIRLQTSVDISLVSRREKQEAAAAAGLYRHKTRGFWVFN